MITLNTAIKCWLLSHTFRKWDFTNELIGGMSVIHSVIRVCAAADSNRVRRCRTTASCRNTTTSSHRWRPLQLSTILGLLSTCISEHTWHQYDGTQSSLSNPATWQPGFNLPCSRRSRLSRFHTDQDQSHANVHRQGLANSAIGKCRQQHINEPHSQLLTTCSLTKFKGKLQSLHNDDDDTLMSENHSNYSTCYINWKTVLLAAE